MRSRRGCVALLTAAVVAGGCSSEHDSSHRGAGPSPSSAPTSTVDIPRRAVALTQDLPSGAPPRVLYLVGKPLSLAAWRLVQPDGRSPAGRFPRAPFARVGDSVVSVESAEGTSTVLVSDLGDRVRPTTYPSNTGLAVSHGGGVVGWIGLDHYDSSTGDYRATPVLRFADGSEEHFAPVSSSAVLVGIVGAGCDSHPARCRLVTSVRGRTFLLGHGGRRLLAPASAVDVRADLTTISLRSRRGTCSAVWSARGAPRWRDCRRNFHSFSPAGDHVLAADGFGAYLGASRVDVLDDRDRVEASFRAPRGVTVTQATWEDDRHVLVLLTRDWTTAYLVRLSVGGRASLVFRSRGRIRSLVSYELPLR